MFGCLETLLNGTNLGPYHKNDNKCYRESFSTSLTTRLNMMLETMGRCLIIP